MSPINTDVTQNMYNTNTKVDQSIEIYIIILETIEVGSNPVVDGDLNFQTACIQCVF